MNHRLEHGVLRRLIDRRDLIAESFVLAVVGGLLGAVLAIGGVALVREFGSPHAQGAFQISLGGAMLPRLHEIVVIGIVLGLAGAAGLSRSLTAMLCGLTALDPTTYVAVTSLFAVVTALASYVPARRAAKIDPIDAIRCE